jgi:hypothetical protein
MKKKNIIKITEWEKLIKDAQKSYDREVKRVEKINALHPNMKNLYIPKED